jgi:very-short-patch-repair endonuclease
LAGPDQVAKLFDLEDEFDHVIFDEASQIPIENALPGLTRANRVTVVGDKEQMPPTRLFQQTINREESSNLAADGKTSLLDKADEVWPDKMLKYHYRSKYPELIEFSNQAFYEGQLKIAPQDKVNTESFESISWHQVDGCWEAGTNRVEAEKVIDYLLANLPREEQKLDKTLWGIISFNQKQAEQLSDTLYQKLEDKRRANQDLTKPEQQIWEWCVGSKDDNPYVLIKNLENIQGDEVKHLIISVGYAVDPKLGRVPNRFGLLNRSGGEKRLNVAITRAQTSVDIFCSFDPDYDLEVSSSQNDGPKLFKQYLRFAKAVSEDKQEKAKSILEDVGSNKAEVSYNDYESPFEREVAEKLRERGFEVHTQVGSYGYRIDLGVVDPEAENEYILGIECDGATYHRSKSARERDIYRQLFLEEKGWQIERIWSRKWWEQPEKVLANLEASIKAAQEKSEEAQAEAAKEAEPEKEQVDYLLEEIEYNETFKELTRRIVKLLVETKSKFSNKELQEELDYRDTKGMRKALKPLCEQEIIIKEGAGPGTKYRINYQLDIVDTRKRA